METEAVRARAGGPEVGRCSADRDVDRAFVARAGWRDVFNFDESIGFWGFELSPKKGATRGAVIWQIQPT